MMLAHIVGFGSLVPMLVAVVLGLWQSKPSKAVPALMIGLAISSVAMILIATALTQVG
jgi:hypothetical protein